MCKLRTSLAKVKKKANIKTETTAILWECYLNFAPTKEFSKVWKSNFQEQNYCWVAKLWTP